MSQKSYDRLLKIILIGNSGVGKTDILLSFADYNEAWESAGVDFKLKVVDILGKRVKLQLWDTAGNERYHTITSSCYRGAEGILLVYDVTNTKSFESIPSWLRNVREMSMKNTQIMLVGNNCKKEEKREVSELQGKEFADANGLLFMEVSGQDNINLQEAFTGLAECILGMQKDSCV